MSYERETANALRALGIDPSKHLPTIPVGPVEYTLQERGWFQGFTVSIFVRAKDWTAPNKMHRFMAKCPSCQAVVSFGRIDQHLMGHVIDKVMVRKAMEARRAGDH